MSIDDKFPAEAEGFEGKSEATGGGAACDDGLLVESKADQAKATVEEAVEAVKDAVGHAADKIKKSLGG